jgi:hypothetical protein
MKKLLIGLLSIALTTVAMQAGENFGNNAGFYHVVPGMKPKTSGFFITFTNDTPYNIQHSSSLVRKSPMAVTRPGTESNIEVNAQLTEFPTFTILDDEGDVVAKINPYMPNGAYGKPIFQEHGDITIIGYGGDVVITLNGLAIPHRKVK